MYFFLVITMLDTLALSSNIHRGLFKIGFAKVRKDQNKNKNNYFTLKKTTFITLYKNIE